MIFGGGVTSRIEISLSAQGLKNKDMMSLSDPFAVVYLKGPKDADFIEIGRTEIIANTLSPTWYVCYNEWYPPSLRHQLHSRVCLRRVTRIQVIYRFEEVQILRVKLYDCDTSFKTSDSSGVDLSKQQLQGVVEGPLPSIVKNVGYWNSVLQLPNGSGRGQLSIRTEEIANANGLVKMKLRCSKLANVGTFSRNNSFVQISRLREDSSWVPCYKSEVKMGNTNPVFTEISCTVVQIANGDIFRPLKISAFDWSKGGNHVLIGEAETSLSQISQMAASKSCIGFVDKKKKAPNNAAGELYCDTFSLTPQESFIEYIKGGTEVCQNSIIISLVYFPVV